MGSIVHLGCCTQNTASLLLFFIVTEHKSGEDHNATFQYMYIYLCVWVSILMHI